MAKQPRVLVGQVAAITGGARGIGKETARALVREGVKVAIGDLDLELAQKTAAELGGGGTAVRAYPLDVTDRESVRAFIDAVEADLGPIDIFDSNAGIMPVGTFLEEDDDSTRRQIDINVYGVINGAKEILPRFVERRRGHLVNVASMAGKGGFPGVATYCGTKHFVVGLSESIRGELAYADSPVEVTCVMPAIVQTELATGLKATRGVKPTTPEDVAEAIVDALKVPRFDVFVPKAAGVANTVMGVLPRRGREGLARALKADVALIEADHSARRGYEVRAAESDPHLEAGHQPASLGAGED
ncbi:short chain dehydrogenase [Patulibacter medicamentivorans]|uniref:Short chain dehydrogenase n=1 Tax=Patulibacter medicamentivorans TaxID=1097667 RepID=H0E5A6_9ACTN|nr:SDR family oxidoreductase [Patulibacter medicamentivorans]EHN11139.1 short chain dehydrogenase [Patulibacter medicamentivorans]